MKRKQKIRYEIWLLALLTQLLNIGLLIQNLTLFNYKGIILEETEEGVLNIIMIEMKSKNIKEEKIKKKFKKSLEY